MTTFTLQELANILQKESAEKFDFVAPAKTLRYTVDGRLLNDVSSDMSEAMTAMLAKQGVARSNMLISDVHGFVPTDLFKRQLSDKLGIPMKYFERMQEEAPQLLSQNINHWLSSDDASNYLVRTFVSKDKSIARAFLSDRFRTIDNIDVLFNVLESIKRSNAKVDVKDCKLSETNMYVKVVSPDITCDVKDFDGALPDLGRGHRFPSPDEGAWIATGFIFKNSELGQGKFSISPLAFKLACTNYLIQKDSEIEQVHLGGKLVEGLIQWSEATRTKQLELLMSQTRDAVESFLSPRFLGQVASRIAKAESIVLKHPMNALTNVTQQFKLSEEQQKSILDCFIAEQRPTLGAISDAITFYAHEQEDADTQYELERIGDAVLELNTSLIDKA